MGGWDGVGGRGGVVDQRMRCLGKGTDCGMNRPLKYLPIESPESWAVTSENLCQRALNA